MVDSGITASVCGLEYFCDTLVTVGPPMRLRASNGQPLKHYGQKKVELLSDGGEKMHVIFSVHDVKRAMISTSATAPSGIETHLDEWNPQEGRTISSFKKRTSGDTRWLNRMTRGGLYFLGATVANGQLQQPGADPKSCGYDDRVTFPTWRTSGDVAPVDGDEDMAQAAEVAAGAASVEVAADGDPANNQSPEADGWSNDNVSLAPTDPKGPPMSVGQWAQQNEPTEAETVAQVGATKATRAWTRRLRAWTWPDCVRRCGRGDPHRRRQDQMRDTQQQSFSATILLQRGEGGHHMQKISAAVPGGAASSEAVPGGAASNTTSPGETVLQSPVTVEVAPMTGVQPETPGEAETGEPPYKAARSGDIVMVIDGETLCVPEEDVPEVYHEEDDGQVLPTEQVHEGMQRELQLMRDLEMSERVLRSDVSPGKKIWSTRWCHRRKGTGVRSQFVVRQFRDTDWETAFSGVLGLVVVRILLFVSTILETSIVPGDLVAFMSTPLHDAEYIEPPLEAESDKQYVWKSRKALNGLKKDGHSRGLMRFYDSLKQWLLVRVQDVVGFR